MVPFISTVTTATMPTTRTSTGASAASPWHSKSNVSIFKLPRLYKRRRDFTYLFTAECRFAKNSAIPMRLILIFHSASVWLSRTSHAWSRSRTDWSTGTTCPVPVPVDRVRLHPAMSVYARLRAVDMVLHLCLRLATSVCTSVYPRRHMSCSRT